MRKIKPGQKYKYYLSCNYLKYSIPRGYYILNKYTFFQLLKTNMEFEKHVSKKIWNTFC